MYQKNRELEMICQCFVEVNRFSLSHTHILFCYACELSSRIFLSCAFCAYIEFYKITELLRAPSLVDSCV